MALSEKGVSRQTAHEEIRVLSHEAARNVKVKGGDNDLMARIEKNPFFEPVHGMLGQLLDPRAYTGRASQQVERFTGMGGEVSRALEKYAESLKNVKQVALSV